MRFTLEALPESLIHRELRMEQLHRNPAAVAAVGGLVDHAHPPFPKAAKLIVGEPFRRAGA